MGNCSFYTQEKGALVIHVPSVALFKIMEVYKLEVKLKNKLKCETSFYYR